MATKTAMSKAAATALGLTLLAAPGGLWARTGLDQLKSLAGLQADADPPQLSAAERQPSTRTGARDAGRAASAPGDSDPSAFRFGWDGITYACRNGDGQMGYNPAKVEDVKATKRGECAELGQADLRGVDLSRAYLPGAELSMAIFDRGANLSGTNLQGADIGWTDLTGAVFNNASLRGASLAQCRLAGAKFAEADLRDSNLGGSDLSGADLGKADLRGADLVGTKLVRSPAWHDTRLDGADLTGAKYDGFTKLPFDGAEAARRGMIKP